MRRLTISKITEETGTYELAHNCTFIRDGETWYRNFGNRMRHIISRSDVTKETVISIRNKGLTINQIAEKLNCGYNTVCRRLGMKD